ncbi:hypothetical protein BJP25_20740 [Actinokineospora bangkokensis]|uniref:Uncharacterized protein n=1 Tax=Actinokineospora bangkokensis TaxID=1193682 RepID=A0A1Q9LL64_9PSEU|nr:hypothetical protein BJP25_20740 [Actinokineospora bangkokensis]
MLAAVLTAAALAVPGHAQAQTAAWTLTTAQRQAYLTYYAPLILKRADESSGREGTDWLSNYDFDRDGDFSDNRAHWRDVPAYLAGAHPDWQIRPTAYTALIEYTSAGTKELVLIYHLYNAADKDFKDIHDWERVELRITGVTGDPGTGDTPVYATITDHKDHVMRPASSLNFMPAGTGRHLMVWQADGSDLDSVTVNRHGHELRFATDSWATVAGRMNTGAKAEVDINNDSDKNVHYAFVPAGSAGAVSAWGAQPITGATAGALAANVDDDTDVPWTAVKRVTYELQDLADVVPTHWSGGGWATHWLPDTSVDVLLETPVVGESGAAEVPAGTQRFYTASRDSAAGDLTDGRDGVLSKAWFYGAYSGEANADTISGSDDFGGFAGLGTDSQGRTRGAASGDPASHGAYWRQHDFFVHTGVVDTGERTESGTWLPAGWDRPENGGFDGRWVQLFAD